MRHNRNKAVNDVNGAPHQRLGSAASGRNGDSKATQVVNKRNPCNIPKGTLFNCNKEAYTGTWNVRTHYAAGPLDILLYQLKDMKWSIMGLSEVRWTGAGEIEKDECKIIYAGRSDNKHQDGVALILKKEAIKALIGYDAVNSRILNATYLHICLICY